MNIIIVGGAYKGCEATTFKMGMEDYFTDDTDGSNILLKNHPYIKNDGVLYDIAFLLTIAYGSENLDFFLKAVHKDEHKIKKPMLLSANRINKFYTHNVEIQNKLIELLEKGSQEEEAVLNELLIFINDIFGIGTVIYKSSRWSSSLETIARETSTMWITENDRTKIYKKDKRVVGNSGVSIVLARQEHFEEQEKSKLVYKLKEFSFNKLTLNQLRQINEIIENK